MLIASGVFFIRADAQGGIRKGWVAQKLENKMSVSSTLNKFAANYMSVQWSNSNSNSEILYWSRSEINCWKRKINVKFLLLAAEYWKSTLLLKEKQTLIIACVLISWGWQTEGHARGTIPERSTIAHRLKTVWSKTVLVSLKNGGMNFITGVWQLNNTMASEELQKPQTGRQTQGQTLTWKAYLMAG